jgi:hypothetical protein
MDYQHLHLRIPNVNNNSLNSGIWRDIGLARIVPVAIVQPPLALARHPATIHLPNTTLMLQIRFPIQTRPGSIHILSSIHTGLLSLDNFLAAMIHDAQDCQGFWKGNINSTCRTSTLPMVSPVLYLLCLMDNLLQTSIAVPRCLRCHNVVRDPQDFVGHMRTHSIYCIPKV